MTIIQLDHRWAPVHLSALRGRTVAPALKNPKASARNTTSLGCVRCDFPVFDSLRGKFGWHNAQLRWVWFEDQIGDHRAFGMSQIPRSRHETVLALGQAASSASSFSSLWPPRLGRGQPWLRHRSPRAIPPCRLLFSPMTRLCHRHRARRQQMRRTPFRRHRLHISKPLPTVHPIPIRIL